MSMKKVNLIVVSALILAIAISVMLRVRYQYHYGHQSKNMKAIPVHHTYKQAIQALTDSIVQEAKAKHCSRNLIPVKQINGNRANLNLPMLKADVNLALSSYKKWSLRVNEEEMAEMKKRYDQNTKQWQGLMNSGQIFKNLKIQESNAFNTVYSAQATLYTLSSGNGDDQKLVVKVNDENTGNLVFDAQVTFVNPATLKQWIKDKQKSEDRLASLKKNIDITYKLIILFAGILILYLIFILLRFFILKLREKRLKEYYLNEIQKRQELADNGHFVAAYQLVEKYLKLFPDDSDVIAFRERLLDFTNDDPKKAQVAFVEAKKLQLRLQMAKDDPMQSFLSSDEKKQLEPYLPYNSNLKTTYLALVSGEEEAMNQQVIEEQLKNLKELLNEGKISEAERIINRLKGEAKGNVEFELLQDELEQKKEDANKSFDKLKNLLINFQVGKAEKMLKEILAAYPDMAEAVTLRENIELAEGVNRFKLMTNDDSKSFEFFCNKKLLLGRSDDETIPDIDFHSKQVSRKHLSLSFEKNQLFAEDLQSTGGTFINGQKIEKQPLKNNDLLTLAKVVNLKVNLLHDDKNNFEGALLTGNDVNYLLLYPRVRFDLNNDKVQFGKDNYSFSFQQNKILFINANNLLFISEGIEIEMDDHKYKVVIPGKS